MIRMTRFWLTISFGFLLGLSALPVVAQIRGGEEAAPFTPGDHVILDEDYASIALGGQVPNWKILNGSYEVAEFQGNRWLRPLASATQIVRRVQIPRDFSLEFTTYLFPEAGPVLRIFLATEEDLTYEYGFGPDGPAHVTLWVYRGYNPDHDGLRAWVRVPGTRDMRELISEGSYKFPSDQPHRIALSVRNGQLQLYFDGKRVGVAPFQPEKPLVGISLFFGSGSGHEKPYRERPALFTNLRLAGYSTPQGPRYTGVLLYLMAPSEAKNKLTQPRGENQGVLEELQKRFGWQEANPIQVQAGGESGRGSIVLTSVLRVPLPAAPFREGNTAVRMGQKGEAFIQSLREALEVTRQQVPNAALLIRGQVLEGEGATERERQLLRRMRTLAFASWLAEHGLGDAQSLTSIAANFYEAWPCLRLDTGQYELVVEKIEHSKD